MVIIRLWALSFRKRSLNTFLGYLKYINYNVNPQIPSFLLKVILCHGFFFFFLSLSLHLFSISFSVFHLSSFVKLFWWKTLFAQFLLFTTTAWSTTIFIFVIALRIALIITFFVKFRFVCAKTVIVILLLDFIFLVSLIPCHPSSIIHKLFEIFSDYGQKLNPVQVFALFIENNVASIKPIFNFFNIFNWNWANFHKVFIIFHDKDHIETFNIAVHSFKAYDLDLIDWGDEKSVFNNIY